MVRDVASRTPLLSMAYDAVEGYRLANSILEDESMSDGEIRTMLQRPLPAPPGVSFEVALLRRIAAASALGEVRIVEETHRLAVTNRISEGMLDVLTQLVVMSNAWFGDLQRARAVALELEEKYRNKATKSGASPASWVAKDPTLYLTMLATAAGLGDHALFQRLMSEYPETLDGLPDVKPSTNFTYASGRKAMLTHLLGEEGDYDAALNAAKDLEQIVNQWSTRLSGDDKKSLTDARMGHLVYLATFSAQTRKPEAALRYVDTIREMAKRDPSSRSIRQGLLDAEAQYLAATGRHSEALQRLEEHWKLQPRVIRAGKIAREGYARDKTRLQLAVGAYEQVLATVESMGGLKDLSIRYYRDGALAYKAYAHASLGQVQQDLSALDDLDKDMSRRIGTDNARFHFAVKTIAHYAAFKARRSDANLRQSVIGGRAFASSYRRMRSTGQYGDINTPPDLFVRAKEAYLLATIAAVGRFGVTVDEVLDAFSLFYDSETEEDIASAALRTSVQGLSAGEVRHLQDLRLAARKAARQLDIISKQGTPRDIETAASAMERATRTYEDDLVRLQSKAPTLTQMLTARIATLAQMRDRLHSGEALVAFAPTPDGTASLVVTKSSIAHKVLPLTTARAKELVDRVRETVRFDKFGNVAPYDASAAAELYGQLLSWASPQLNDITQLAIVSKGSLASIPFGLLVMQPASGSDYRSFHWLIRKYAITHAPAITSWTLAGSNSRGVGTRTSSFLAWADPDFGGSAGEPAISDCSVRRSLPRIAASAGTGAAVPQSRTIDLARLPRLKETREEAEAIARAVGADPRADIIAGSQATRASVLSASSSGKMNGTGIVMFATHGLAPDELPGLAQPALAMAKDASGSDLPLLTLDDVVGLRTNADWVLLSACNTSAAERAGGDALSGLARGFFFAGAKSLLVTHWEVDSCSAAKITVKTIEKYASNPKLTRAQALQWASIDLIDGKQVPSKWAHPAFWAPYALVGNGRR